MDREILLIRLFNTQRVFLSEALLHNRQNYGSEFLADWKNIKKWSTFDHGFSFHLMAFFVGGKRCYPLLLNLLATDSNSLVSINVAATLATLKRVDFNSYPMNNMIFHRPNWFQTNSFSELVGNSEN